MKVKEKEIIANGHPPMADKVILVDFDGTIFPFGYLFDYPEPLPGAIESLKTLQSSGYKIWIFTSRLSPKWLESVGNTAEEHIRYIVEILHTHGISVEGVTAEKIPCEAYIDDKAYRYENNNWYDLAEAIIKRR